MGKYNKSNDERTNRRNENIIPEETQQQQQQQNQNKHYEMDAQTQILQQKQYSNPYLQRMKLQQQKQQELIRQQLKNQNDRLIVLNKCFHRNNHYIFFYKKINYLFSLIILFKALLFFHMFVLKSGKINWKNLYNIC